MEKEADSDKVCSESVAENESLEDEEETDRFSQELEAQGLVPSKRKNAGHKSC